MAGGGGRGGSDAEGGLLKPGGGGKDMMNGGILSYIFSRAGTEAADECGGPLPISSRDVPSGPVPEKGPKW